MGILDKIKGLFTGRERQVKGGIDKVSDNVERKVPGHAERIDDLSGKAGDAVDKLGGGPVTETTSTTSTPPAASTPSAGSPTTPTSSTPAQSSPSSAPTGSGPATPTSPIAPPESTPPA